ncbi:Hypothetical protein, putative [Bodo saltans]|uniref:Uncharacterized protein n=1 Tax=Bodo saltans TaxID=75058 RepID=A0A0S4JFE5_BODSA|nr:Hypothetical protein, putative [Bodo saltans]|eukprot:CUG87107.1 Hypothetical protein, putative [Bodo saltans]
MDSPKRAASPIAVSSRLLQATTSTLLKSKESTSSPIQRDSLSFHNAIRLGSPARRSDSPSSHQRTQSPRCRAEAYALHFQGNGVAHLFGSSAQNSRSNSPSVPAKAVRRQSPHRDDSMFASECPSTHRVVTRLPSAITGNTPTTRQPGLWTRKEGGDERVAYTGSRRHFGEIQQASVVGSAASSPLASHYRSLESTLDAAEVVSIASDAFSSTNGQRFTKRILEQQNNISGSSCHVAHEQPIAARGKQRSDRFQNRKTGPYHDESLPSTSANDGGNSAPANSAPMLQRGGGAASEQRNSKSINSSVAAANAKTTILDYRESGWSQQQQNSAPHRRERAPVEGVANNVSRNVTNLSAHSAVEVGEKPVSIKTMAGPPAFIPAPMRAPSPLGQRLDSPFRAKGQNGTFSISSMASAAVSVASSPAPSGAATPRAMSPVRAGRGVGLYSPLRQTSLFN